MFKNVVRTNERCFALDFRGSFDKFIIIARCPQSNTFFLYMFFGLSDSSNYVEVGKPESGLARTRIEPDFFEFDSIYSYQSLEDYYLKYEVVFTRV